MRLLGIGDYLIGIQMSNIYSLSSVRCSQCWLSNYILITSIKNFFIIVIMGKNICYVLIARYGVPKKIAEA